MNTLEPLVDFYKTHKWGQGDHRAGSEEYCLIEAKCAQHNIPFHNFPFLWDQVSEELRRRCNQKVVGFNDAPGRTFEEVMEMLRRDDSH